MRFNAGQFVNVEVPGKDEVRTYSIASPPSQSGELDLYVKLRPDGHFSGLLSGELALGARLRVFGPYGQLRVRLSHRPILMVASGSGLAPILSMLTDLVEKESQRAVRLFVGVRGADDLFALGQIDAIARALPAFEFVPVLSHDWPADWTGETGALNDAIARHVPSAHDHDAYVCGSTWCIETMLPLLLRLGVRRRNIYFDAFTPAAR